MTHVQERETEKLTRGPQDSELLAIARINRELTRLDADARQRVLCYITNRHRPAGVPVKPALAGMPGLSND